MNSNMMKTVQRLEDAELAATAPLPAVPPLQTSSAGQSAVLLMPENPPIVYMQDLVLLSVAFFEAQALWTEHVTPLLVVLTVRQW
jgi:hypothetical protein